MRRLDYMVAQFSARALWRTVLIFFGEVERFLYI
jgi:hypothetical protein